MANIVNLHAEAGATIDADDAQPTLTLTNSSSGGALKLSTSSTASTTLLTLSPTAFVSAVSLIFAASANWAGMGAFRVERPDGTFGWVPVLPDGQVTAAAV